MRFTKMEGIGNDYIFVDCFEETVEEPEELSRRISDRHFGVGGDGLILVLPSETADCRMRIFNADGSEAEMCGNGVRCVAKLMWDKGRIPEGRLTVDTGAGLREIGLVLENGQCRGAVVDMGEPVITDPPGTELEIPFEGKEKVAFTGVSMGNPHCVIFLERGQTPAVLDLPAIGPVFENHPHFPHRTNTEFVRVEEDGSLTMRVWERGSGETMACGTGACAVAVAAVENGLAARGQDITIHLNGGDLSIKWAPAEEDEGAGRVYMTGPARTAFEGVWEDRS